MSLINSLSEESSSPSLSVEDIRALVRLAPMLMLVIALGGCKADPKLAACRIETAKIEGILKGVGIDHEPGETGNLQECLVANERVKGVMKGAAMKSDSIKVKLEALGVDLSFSVPAGKSHPELSGTNRSGKARKESGGSADLAYPELSKDFQFLASIRSEDFRSKFGEKPKFPASPVNSSLQSDGIRKYIDTHEFPLLPPELTAKMSDQQLLERYLAAERGFHLHPSARYWLETVVAEESGQKWVWIPLNMDRLSSGFDPYTKRAMWMPMALYLAVMTARDVKYYEETIASLRPGDDIPLWREGLAHAKRQHERALAELQ